MKDIFKPRLEWLLIFLPVAVVLRFAGPANDGAALFICAGLAIIPLAGLMGRATEELGHHFGHGVGGLLNATFGNAAELIIALMALRRGLVEVVKASITGSIICNTLLVLGGAIVAGGTKYSEQRFNKVAVRTSTASLMLAAIGLLIPSVFHTTGGSRSVAWTAELEQNLSLAIAIVLFLTYACTLLFSLKTHRDLYTGEQSDDAHASWSRTRALLVLVVATAFVAWLSEFLVDTIEAARKQFGFSEVFVGVVVVAIVGNAAEHATAVVMARKNKMDLSIGIAVGSSMQIALFLAPVLVFASYFLGSPMTLEFTIPEVVSVIVAVFIVAQISGDGKSNWLEGAQLLSVYLVLGILFYYL